MLYKEASLHYVTYTGNRVKVQMFREFVVLLF